MKKLKINQKYIYISDFPMDGGCIVYFTGNSCVKHDLKYYIFRGENSSEDILIEESEIEKNISILK